MNSSFRGIMNEKLEDVPGEGRSIKRLYWSSTGLSEYNAPDRKGGWTESARAREMLLISPAWNQFEITREQGCSIHDRNNDDPV